MADPVVIEHHHDVTVVRDDDGRHRFYARCSCGEIRRRDWFDTEWEARRYLARHALDGQLSYRFNDGPPL